MSGHDIYEGCYGEKHFYKMTDSQLGVYLDSNKNPESDMYNLPCCCSISKEYSMDIGRLKEAIIEVIEGYPFMKVNVDLVDGEPVMVRSDGRGYDIPIRQARQAEMEAIKKTFSKLFDLKKDLLFRFEIVETEEKIYLLFEFHHIIADMTSAKIFLKRVSDAYEGKELKSETINSFTLSNYEEKIKDSDSYKKSGEYFERLLGGLEIDSNIIPDREEDPSNNDEPYQTIKISLKDHLDSEETTKLLKTYGLKENTLFLAAFSYALAKYTGQEESLFTTASSGRFKPGLENTMGMLVRTLPIYTKIDEEAMSFDYLKQVQAGFYGTLKNEEYSFLEISKDYGVNADIMYNYLGYELDQVSLAGNPISFELMERKNNMCKLQLLVRKKDDSYELAFEYREDIYKPETIQAFAGILLKTIEGLISGMELKEISLVSSEDIQKYKSFNSNTLNYDRNITVLDMFKEKVEKHPDKIAIVFKDKKLSYSGLDNLSDKLASYLRKKGIARDIPVAIMIARSEMMAVCPVGVLKAGGVYQPIDANSPKERIDYMLSDSGAKVLILDYELRQLVTEFDGEIIYTKDIEDLPVEEFIEPEIPKVEDLFVLLYTSGSTGMPKGCMLTHGSMANLCLVYQEKYGVAEADISAAYASFSFDACLADIYPYLAVGGSVHIIAEDIRLDMPKIDKYLRDNKISIIFFTTQLGRQYVSEYGDNPYIRTLIVGGETLVPCQPPSFDFYNGYGPTECTVMVSSFKIDKMQKKFPIGKAFPNNDIYILDKHSRMLPVGVPGELCIAGHQVSRGYLNREDLTKEKFISNPHSDKEGYEIIYKTGDICRYLEDGNIEFIGRRDFQVKIRGFRVELTEIEAKIRDYKGIKDATMLSKDGPSGEKSILAYIVSDEKIDIDLLKEFIGKDLPYYMVPSAIMQIDSIPLNQNDKVDKRKLPEIRYEEEKAGKDTRPLTSLEKGLSEIVTEILGHSDFSLDSNLMYRGLNSLTTIKLASLISKKYGYSPDVKSMMKETSILSLEDEIQNYLLERLYTGPEKTEEVVGEVKTHYPLSHGQKGVYYESMKRPRSTIYNEPMMMKFSNKTDMERLYSSLKSVLEAHPYISTHLEMMGSEVMQVRNECDVDIDSIKMTEDELLTFKKDFVKPFDLFEGPLYRLVLAETEEAKYILSDFHHIIFDGGSYDLLLHQIKDAYEGQGVEPEDYSYYQYIEDQKNIDKEEYLEAEQYFHSRLQYMESASEIPLDLSGNEEEGKTAEVVYKLDKKKIDKFCSQEGVTPAQVFLAGTLYTTARFTNSEDAYISTISGGRSDLKIRNSFGMFVNTIPLSGNIGRGKTAEAFLQETKNTFRDSIGYEYYPFDKLSAKYNFSPQLMYVCQIGVLDQVEMDGELIERQFLEAGTSKFKITVSIEERDGDIGVCVQYNDSLYSKGAMEIFSEALATSTLNIIDGMDRDISEISMVSKEQAAILKKFNYGEKVEIGEKILHKRFEEQARLDPDRKALIACDGEFTFAEMDKLTNKVANALIHYGVELEDYVALLLPRDSRLITSMYGILKAGGAYIPCDTEYPIQRINHILDDSGAPYVITTRDRVEHFKEGRAIDVDSLIAWEDDSNPKVDVKASNLAYSIYTSGSTGNPKGVMIEHRGISNCIYSGKENPHAHAMVSEGRVILSVTTISFDLSSEEIALALCNGLTLVLADENETKDPLLLGDLFARTGADLFNVTPSRMLQYLEMDSLRHHIKNCKVIMCAGEKYSEKLLETFKSLKGTRIFNGYGPTEATVAANKKDLTNANRITVGRPLHNFLEFIADSDGNELPLGVVGELYIGGVGVSRGYKNLEKLSSERFIPYKGVRTYKSGDYAKWTKDGEVIILGRTDNQIKLRGLRIELEEIESCILKYEGIKDVVVIIKKINDIEHICAYFSASKHIDPKDLKNFLSATLTNYMVPTAFLQMENLPIAPSGKTDVKNLPQPELIVSSEYVEPRTAREKIFCDIFSKILKLPRVGATDNFFNLGGTSLVVTSVVVEALKYKFEVGYADVFSHPTPRKLASMVGGEDPESDIEDDYEDISKYEYGRIEEVLKLNTLDNFKNGKRQELGNILLTGPTGFLGIHILEEFLNSEKGIAYCLIRKKEEISSQNRLKSILYYYFDQSYEELFKDRIIVIDGDITDRDSFKTLNSLPIDTVINCAANVKHFSKGTDIEDVNFHGVENIIDFCLEKDCRLIQTSTVSISGFDIGQLEDSDTIMDEAMLYFGQNLDNKYCHSKFLAERLVLEKISEGLNAKIMRVGNLSARDLDGQFQINFNTNSFAGRLRAFAAVGKFPYEFMDQSVEMSSIDSVAKSILLLSKTPKECSVFHAYNNHTVEMGDIIYQMKDLDMDIELSELEAYEMALSLAKEDPEKAKILSSIIAYEGSSNGKNLISIDSKNIYTLQVLYRMGYRWPNLSNEYIERFLLSLSGLGFFD